MTPPPVRSTLALVLLVSLTAAGCVPWPLGGSDVTLRSADGSDVRLRPADGSDVRLRPADGSDVPLRPADGSDVRRTAGHEQRGTDGVGSEAGTRARGAAPPWVWPTGVRDVVRAWEAPADDYAAGHRGIDVAATVGTAAVAVADGTVSFAGPVGGRSVVSIDHGGGLVSTLDSVDPAVTSGTVVAQGDPVGTVAVGHCPASAPCLHLGARIDGRYVDPLPWLPAADWPVLLPESAWPG